MRSIVRRVVAGAAAAAVISLTATAPVAGAATEQDPTPQTKAQAIVEPSIVYLQTTWSGYVKLDGERFGDPYNNNEPFSATSNCSGFVADSDGHIVTAGHCVDGGKEKIFGQYAKVLVADGSIGAGEVDSYVAYWMENLSLVGERAGSSQPDRSIGVFQNVAASGIAVSTPMQADLVASKSLAKGDVALVKVVPDNPMPAVELAAGTPENGTEIVAAGYPGSVSGNVDANQRPSLKTGSVSSSQTSGGVPFTEIDAATTQGMSGGPVVGLDGKVIGTVSWGPVTQEGTQEDKNFGFVTDTALLRDFLQSNDVSPTLSATDRTYREGLSQYYAGKFHAAADSFEAVLAQVPNHAQAQEFKSKATVRFDEESILSYMPWLLWAGAGALLLLAGGGTTLGLVLSRRRKAKRAAADQQVPMTERTPVLNGHPPVVTEQVPTVAEPAVTAPLQLAGPNGHPADAVGGFCTSCGHPHQVGERFCSECGHAYEPAVA